MQNEDACAEYIADMCKQLTELAKENGFHVGAYMLAIAALEFANQTHLPNEEQKQALDQGRVKMLR